MNRIQLEHFDLNLLTVLHAVHAEGSVTRAAGRLALTQSAVSHALRRLRRLTGDPLFVRHGAGIVATPFTKNLVGPLQSALRGLEAALSAATGFDPATSSRRFVVGMDERLEVHALPAFVERLFSEAPRIEFDSVRTDADAIAAQLASGTLDVAVSAANIRRPDLHWARVARDGLVVLARRDHPQVRGSTLGLQQYLAAEHIAVTPYPNARTEEDLALGRAGHLRRIRVRTQRYVAAVEIVARSNLLLTMPRLYAEVVNAVAANRVLRLPVRIPPLEYFLYWHASADADAGGHWLRDAIRRSFGARVHEGSESGPSPAGRRLR